MNPGDQKAVLLIGTGNLAGKSLLAAAIGRLLYRRGLKVAPFQARSTSPIAYTTNEGRTIAYFQAAQAWAAGIDPRGDFNPIRPDSDLPESEAQERIQQAISRLFRSFDVLVADGVGSPADVYLSDRDWCNLSLARELQAPVVLVVDADRGGWLASAIGTLELIDPADRPLVRAILVNKYRGDRQALQQGLGWLQTRTGIPVVGAVPWLPNLFPTPDSIDLFARRRCQSDIETTVTAIRLPHIASFSDLDPLSAEPTVGLRYAELDSDLGYPDAVVLPRSNDLASDLTALYDSGMAENLRQYAIAGGTILGIGEGFQMLGRQIVQLQGLDTESQELIGLDLLPISSIVTGDWIDRERVATSNYPQAGLPVASRELRQSYTQILESGSVNALFDDPKLGVVATSQLVWGTYLSNVFDSSPWRRAWLNRLRHQRGLSSLPTGMPDYSEHRDLLLDSLADEVAKHLDLDRLWSAIGMTH